MFHHHMIDPALKMTARRLAPQFRHPFQPLGTHAYQSLRKRLLHALLDKDFQVSRHVQPAHIRTEHVFAGHQLHVHPRHLRQNFSAAHCLVPAMTIEHQHVTGGFEIATEHVPAAMDQIVALFQKLAIGYPPVATMTTSGLSANTSSASA